MHLFFIFWQELPTFFRVISVVTNTKRIVIRNYSYNKICDEHTVDMLLPLNTIDEFLITRFINVKRVHYNDQSLLKSYDSYTNTYAYYCLSLSSNNDPMIEQTYLKLFGAMIHSLSWNRNMI
jgi:hypothetical protein